MLVTVAPLAVAVIGLMVYALCGPKMAEVGRLAFFCGLIVLVFQLAGRTVRLP